MRKDISNKEYEEALKNKDFRNIMKSVTQKYSKQISQEELDNAALHALWRMLQYYDKSFGQKPTSSLYRFLHWECRRILKNQNKNPAISISEKNIDIEVKPQYDSSQDIEFIKQKINLLNSEDQRTIIRQYYFDNMTMAQIAKISGCGSECIRLRLKKAINHLKELCSRCT